MRSRIALEGIVPRRGTVDPDIVDGFLVSALRRGREVAIATVKPWKPGCYCAQVSGGNGPPALLINVCGGAWWFMHRRHLGSLGSIPINHGEELVRIQRATIYRIGGT